MGVPEVVNSRLVKKMKRAKDSNCRMASTRRWAPSQDPTEVTRHSFSLRDALSGAGTTVTV